MEAVLKMVFGSQEALTQILLVKNVRASLIVFQLLITFSFSSHREDEVALGVLANDASWPHGPRRLIRVITPRLQRIWIFVHDAVCLHCVNLYKRQVINKLFVSKTLYVSFIADMFVLICS